MSTEKSEPPLKIRGPMDWQRFIQFMTSALTCPENMVAFKKYLAENQGLRHGDYGYPVSSDVYADCQQKARSLEMAMDSISRLISRQISLLELNIKGGTPYERLAALFEAISVNAVDASRYRFVRTGEGTDPTRYGQMLTGASLDNFVDLHRE